MKFDFTQSIAHRQRRSAILAAGNAQFLPVDDRRKLTARNSVKPPRWNATAHNIVQPWQLRSTTNNGGFGQSSDFRAPAFNGTPVANFETPREMASGATAGLSSSESPGIPPASRASSNTHPTNRSVSLLQRNQLSDFAS